MPPFFTTLITLFLPLLLVASGYRGAAAAAAAPTAASRHLRRAQGTFQGGQGWVFHGCGPNQCYVQKYNGCFHATSAECTNPDNFNGAITAPPPTPRPVLQWIETENPALLKMLNVAEDYVLSPSERASLLKEVRTLLEATLDPDFWEVLSVESPGAYIGERRLQSSSSSLLRLRGGHMGRRLENTLYLPIVVTVRVREDMSDMSRLFILQSLRDKLMTPLMYLKSINPDAFRNLQLGWDELSLSDVGKYSLDIQTTVTKTEERTETTSSVEVKSTGTPFWVWIIVAAVLIPLTFCLLLCMCRAGWCLCCTDCGGRKRMYDKDDDYESHIRKQLAINRSREQQPVQKRSVVVPRPRNNSGVGRSYESESRRRSDANASDRLRRSGRGRAERRRSHDEYFAGGYPNMNEQGQGGARRPSGSKMKRTQSESDLGMMKRTHSKIDLTELARKLNDPPVEYQNALVVYNAENNPTLLDPEAPEIDDLPSRETALVVFNPPKEPEVDTLEVPRKKTRRLSHYDEEDVYMCSIDEVHPLDDSEKPQAMRRNSNTLVKEVDDGDDVVDEISSNKNVTPGQRKNDRRRKSARRGSGTLQKKSFQKRADEWDEISISTDESDQQEKPQDDRKRLSRRNSGSYQKKQG